MIYVLSGGQTGATLTVTSSGAGTITVSNTSLGKSYSKSVTAGGSAVFKGLQTGTWTIKLTDGSKTSTKNITITSDYSTNIAYFSATISITYPATSTCVVTNSGGQTVASDTNTGSSAKTWTATVGATGTYTVTATATDGSGKSKSTTVNITTDGQSESVTLSYEVYLIQNGSVNSTFKFGNAQLRSDHSASASTGSGYIQYSSTSYTCGVATPSRVDLSKYSKLVMNCNVTSLGNGNVRLSVCSALSAGSEAGVLSNISASKNTSSTGSQTLTLDLSSITSSLYVGLVLDTPEWSTVAVQVMNMYLE